MQTVILRTILPRLGLHHFLVRDNLTLNWEHQ
jgi:hypothetical protein